MSICDHKVAGVIIGNGSGRYLLFDRNTFPAGTAPVAGHVDDHGSFEDAARAEVREEVGLTVATLDHVTGGWRANACRRVTGPEGVGHEWQVYRATVTGTLNPSPRETRNARWLTLEDLQALAGQTAWYARGAGSELGLEPVWVQWLIDAGLGLTMHPSTLADIDRLASTPEAVSQ